MFYFSLRGNRRLNLFAIGATFLAVMVLLVGIVHLPENNPLARLLTQGQQNSTATYSDQARSQLFQDDLARIDAHPFFGDGFSDIVNVHVAYLQGWVAAGALAGLVTMIVGLAMLILPLVTKRRDLALSCGAAAIAVAWLFTNIFTAREPMAVPGHRVQHRAVHHGPRPTAERGAGPSGRSEGARIGNRALLRARRRRCAVWSGHRVRST